MERDFELHNIFSQIRARNDILVIAVTLPIRLQIILTQLILFLWTKSPNGAADVCRSRNLFLSSSLRVLMILHLFFQKSVLIQHRLLGVDLIEQAGEQLTPSGDSDPRLDQYASRKEDLGTRLRRMIRGRIQRPRMGGWRIEDRRIRLYNIQRVRIRRPYIQEKWMWVEGQRIKRILTG